MSPPKGSGPIFCAPTSMTPSRTPCSSKAAQSQSCGKSYCLAFVSSMPLFKRGETSDPQVRGDSAPGPLGHRPHADAGVCSSLHSNRVASKMLYKYIPCNIWDILRLSMICSSEIKISLTVLYFYLINLAAPITRSLCQGKSWCSKIRGLLITEGIC